MEYEFGLTDQFASVQRHGGWLRYGNYGFRVRRGRIVEFHLACSPTLLKGVHSHAEVMQRFGRPDRIDPWWNTGELMWSEFVYTRGLRVHFDEWDHFVSHINVGDSLIDDEHEQPKIPKSLFEDA